MQLHPPAIVDRKVRFALAGCGRIAANHALNDIYAMEVL